MFDLSESDIRGMVQLNHPEKFLSFFPGVNEVTAAAFFGLELEKYQDIKNYFKKNAMNAAKELLKDDDFRAAVHELPFFPGQTVLGFGDSITDDYQSWFEILKNVLDLTYGENAIKTVNAGISGDTSMNLIRRILIDNFTLISLPL